MKSIRLKATHVAFILGLSLFVFIIGCSKEDDNPVGPSGGSTTQSIPPGGGSVTHSSAMVTIPPGALNDTTDITVAALSNPPSYTPPANTALIGQVYQFTPDGQTFTLSVAVQFEYTDGQLGSLNENTVTIYTFDAPGGTATAIAGIVRDAVNNTVSGSTTHFSYFYIGAAPQQGGTYPPPSGGNPVGDWTLDHIDYDLTTPLPDTVQLEISGSGNGTLHIGSTDWNQATGIDISTYMAVWYFVQWFVFVDTTIHDTTNASGTYTVEGDTLIATVTASTTDPGMVGDIQHSAFTAESNRLIFYYAGEFEEYSYNMWIVYVR